MAGAWKTSVGSVVASVLVGLCTPLGAAVSPASADPLGHIPAAQLDFGGMVRTYQLHLPPGTDKPSGLVVNLHAAGLTGADQAALTHYDSVADAHGFAVVYPDGVDRSWADGRGASTPDRQGVDDVGFISALVDRLVADFGIPPGRVFVTGLSAGAFMANRLACDRADLFAAIAPVAGTLGSNVGCGPSRPVSVLAMSGTADPIVPFGGGVMNGRGGTSTVLAATELVDRWRGLDGCPNDPAPERLPVTGDGTSTEQLTYSPCAAGTAVVFMRVENGGHTWPGAPEVLPPQQVGPAIRAFDASQMSLQFFEAHSR
jgi:polyhydroxybutyrate depolymerase